MVNENIEPQDKERPAEPPKILTKPLPQILDEMESNIRSAADTAAKVANEALAMTEGAIPKTLVRKILASWDFLVILIVVLLAAIMGAVALSLGISFIGQ
ncbi:hypothetical protein ACFLVW_02295 [Chloroflexota bacterium]